MKNIYGNNILITGASSGIGYTCAMAFAQNGCHVIGTSRRKTKSQCYANGGSFESLHMDVTNDEEVSRVISKLDHIDIAVLCAGMGVAGPVEELSIALAKEQMEVNYFGSLRVCQAVLRKMRKQGGNGLVIVISSIAGRLPIPMQSHYSSSKYALEAMVECIRMEMQRFNIHAVLVEPGDTNTGFTDSRRFYKQKDSVYHELCKSSVSKMARDEQNGRSPSSVASVVLKLAGRKRPPIRIVIGAEYKLLMFLTRFVPDRLIALLLRKRYLS